jgi:hypothetical protein
MNTTDDFLADYEGLLREAAGRLARGARPRRSRRPTLRVLAPLAAIGVTAVLVIALPAVLRPDARDSTGAGAPPFSVLDRPAGETIPGPLVSALAEDAAVREAGPRWSEGRWAAERTGVSVALVPAAAQLCLVVAAEDFGTEFTCAGIANAGAGELMVRIARGDGSIVAGAMPDGVTSVSLGDRVAPVDGNAYVLSAGDESGQLTWDDGAGGRGATELPPSPVAAP